jgi:hypothetical protein
MTQTAAQTGVQALNSPITSEYRIRHPWGPTIRISVMCKQDTISSPNKPLGSTNNEETGLKQLVSCNVNPQLHATKATTSSPRSEIVFSIILPSANNLINFGRTLTNQNPIHEEIKSRLRSMNSCCHSVQTLLSFTPLSKN